MKTYLIKFSDREEGPYAEAQVAQMFADGRIDRNTPCKPSDGGEWKTIDDYLPMLKYGTQLPTPAPSKSVLSTAPGSPQAGVTISDIDVPFSSVLKMAFKIFAAWLIVAVCLVPIFLILWFLLFAGIIGFFGQTFSGGWP